MIANAAKESKEKIEQLLERYTKSYVESTGVQGSRADDYSEQDTATKFIKPLIHALGWNMLDMREVREEVYLDKKRIDCVAYSGGKPHIVFEFKSLGFGELRRNVDVAELVSSAKALGAEHAVLTRFRETIIYDPETGEEIGYFVPTDYSSKFDIVWKHLSKPLVM